jgi:hypothetical protein
MIHRRTVSHQQVNFQLRGLHSFFKIRLTLDLGRATGRLGSRHVFAFLGFLGLATAYMMRVNLSVAIVDMVSTSGPKGFRYNGSSADPRDQCPTDPVSDPDPQVYPSD